MTSKLPPSAFAVFRHAAMLASFAVGVHKLLPLWFLGPMSLPYMHYPLTSLVLALFDLKTDALAGQLQPIFWLSLALYVLLFSLFAWAFWQRTRETAPLPRRSAFWLLAAQIGLALLVDDKLLYLVAAELAFLLPRSPALAWLGALSALTIALHLFHLSQAEAIPLVCRAGTTEPMPLPADQRRIHIAVDLATKLAFQLVTFGIGYLGAAEQRRRTKQAAAHAGLLATQQMLADAAGASERVRIARDLHDAVGHHLTALNLHLDLAVRRAGSSVATPLLMARELARQLLAEVRNAVSIERTERPSSDPP